jgi:SAM-dependent methyltransferase
VRREQGRGTFLARRRVSAETTKVGSLRNGLSLDARSSLETRLLALERRSATAEDAQRLALGDAAIVWEVSRLRLLDAGCGTGHNLRHLAGDGPAVGIDLSAEALRPLCPAEANTACARREEQTLVEAATWRAEAAGVRRGTGSSRSLARLPPGRSPSTVSAWFDAKASRLPHGDGAGLDDGGGRAQELTLLQSLPSDRALTGPPVFIIIINQGSQPATGEAMGTMRRLLGGPVAVLLLAGVPPSRPIRRKANID